MITYTWSILEVLSQDKIITEVHFLLKAQDETNTVETQGYHSFHEGTIVKPYSEIKEEDLTRWIEQDTTQNEINPLKLNLENQLNYLKNQVKKSEFPWLANTFTIE
jgi:hypothetical protein